MEQWFSYGISGFDHFVRIVNFFSVVSVFLQSTEKWSKCHFLRTEKFVNLLETKTIKQIESNNFGTQLLHNLCWWCRWCHYTTVRSIHTGKKKTKSTNVNRVQYLFWVVVVAFSRLRSTLSNAYNIATQYKFSRWITHAYKRSHV